MNRPLSKKKGAAHLLAAIFLLGCGRQCRETSAVQCGLVSIRVDPGQCVEFTNPCEDHQWKFFDGLRLCDGDPNSGLSVLTQSDPTSRFLCAAADMAPVLDRAVEYFYGNNFGTGTGLFRVTVGSKLLLTASANPTTIQPGETSQLSVSITGNATPPFTFFWSPHESVNLPLSQDPLAFPSATTEYTVTVTDNFGSQAQASVVVNVGLGLEVTATPSMIDPGLTSSLLAVPQGGAGPYTYHWTPAGSLDDAASAAPKATPANTTSYNVVVTDSLGATAFGAVTVTVNLAASATASPPTINEGEQSQLSAMVQGGTLPYNYLWTPAETLDDPFAPNPLASPPITTTYSVTVTDGAGAQRSAPVLVEVVPASGVMACITSIVQTTYGPFLFEAQADGSCSTGAIVTYRWWADFNFEGQLPTWVTPAPIPPAFLYEEVGAVDVRLEVEDAMGSRHSVIVPFTVVSDP